MWPCRLGGKVPGPIMNSLVGRPWRIILQTVEAFLRWDRTLEIATIIDKSLPATTNLCHVHACTTLRNWEDFSPSLPSAGRDVDYHNLYRHIISYNFRCLPRHYVFVFCAAAA